MNALKDSVGIVLARVGSSLPGVVGAIVTLTIGWVLARMRACACGPAVGARGRETVLLGRRELPQVLCEGTDRTPVLGHSRVEQRPRPAA